MLIAAIAFLAIGLLAMFLGLNGMMGISPDNGKLLLTVFLVLALLSFITALFRGRKRRGPSI